MSYKDTMDKITALARKASRHLVEIDSRLKNKILFDMAEAVKSSSKTIKEANQQDIDVSNKKGMNRAYIDRLKLDDSRIEGMCQMMRDVADLKDPIGEVIERIERPNKLIIEKVRVPIGVIGIIYESRPNVTADCAALCLKSSNAVILRGGSDAINSNKAIYYSMKAAAVNNGLDENSFILLEDASRELVDEMLKAVGGIDLIMPRGGESLINDVARKSRVPVIKHYKGLCHVYVDDEADLKMAEEICINAKVQRPGVCNAMETMLVNEKIATEFIKRVYKRLNDSGVTVKGCEKTKSILSGEKVLSAGDKEYSTEYLDLILNVKVVDSVDSAIDHIQAFGSNHSDAIVTNNKDHADRFTKLVDSSSVYVNASTRFTDGGEFGKGAEIGISTDKLHARGPMGLEELTTYKYVIHGTGQIR